MIFVIFIMSSRSVEVDRGATFWLVAFIPRKYLTCTAFKPHHGHTRQLFGSLASLAMGDCQAVELAQSCHLSMGLQHQVLSEASLLTMVKPVPRSDTMMGIVIDDFITLTKAPMDAGSEQVGLSPGAMAASKMQEVYKQVGLIPHEQKAFRDEEAATFWGADLDGAAGLLRGSLKRAIPLAGILFKMAEAGDHNRQPHADSGGVADFTVFVSPTSSCTTGSIV